jgi:hypothetical protein
MIGPAPGAKVMVATRPVDFRKGAGSLAALVASEYGGKPYSGVICVFYQGSEMLTHQALEMLKRRTGLTKARWVGPIALWYCAPGAQTGSS